MPAAVPDYLQNPKNFDQAPPGHRFGMYFSGWEADWTMPGNKTPALQRIVNILAPDSRSQLEALVARQKANAAALREHVLSLPYIATAPFVTGLGNEHPLENGFAFLAPYGLPYLAGSGVKGVIRRAAEELVSGDWGDAHGWNAEIIRALFGPGEKDPQRDSDPQQGALRFWDVFPQPESSVRNDKPLLALEIMTPHHSGYYQDARTPHNSESPTPIVFLAVAARARFAFHIECHPARLPAAFNNSWSSLIEAALEHAGQWLGFGAKTAVGYGRMALDPALADQRDAARARAQAETEAATKAAALAAMPADQRLIAELETLRAKWRKNPKNNQPILQPTSDTFWQEALASLTAGIDGLALIDLPVREALAAHVKKILTTHFKVEGKADKAMKACLAALRGQTP